MVCRWGRVWVLAAAPSVESTIAPTPAPVASKKSTKATEDDDFNPDGSDDSNGGSDDASGSEDASAGSDSEDDAVDMTEPTCLKDCEARMGLHTASELNSLFVPPFLETDVVCVLPPRQRQI